MQHLSILTFVFLLLSQSTFTGATQGEEKQWQEIPTENHDAGGAEYTGGDIAQYHQGGGEYTGSDIGSYGGGYTNDYGGQINNNGYTEAGNGYSGDLRNNDYGEQHGNGYGGEQIHSNDYVGEHVQNNGYGGEQAQNGGYGVDVHSNSYSSSSYGDLNGHGFGGAGFAGDDTYGTGLTNEGWERPVKTVVKHVMKNIAVPHPVPAPVHVPVPKYVKYFKPFAIAKPVAVPHVIPVIKHIQKPIPFFASIPVKHNVPVPKFVGLPVQVRVPRPVFIHVPKVVPYAKKVPVPVTVNIPKPYIVPVYKHVPVPVPHKVPKVINVIKEVPHYVKKPVPVYVDDHPSFSSGGNTLTSSTFSNHYGNSGGYENFGGSGYGNEEDTYGGSQGVSSHDDNGFSNIGLDYGNQGKGNQADFAQQGYSGSQLSLILNNPFLLTRQRLQAFRDIQNVQQQKLQLPTRSYPRAHRTPTKEEKTIALANFLQQQALMNYNYSNNVPVSSFELNVELNPNNIGTNANYNTGMPQAGTYNQGQASAQTEMFFQNNKVTNQMSSANSLANSVMKLPIESINSQFSQPLYNPNAYAEFAMSQQSEYNHSYSQPYNDQKTIQNSDAPSQAMVAQASKPQYYNQHPENAYSLGYNSNYQSGGFNNIPNTPNFANFNNQKSQFGGNNNFDFGSAFNNNNNYAKFNQGNEFKAPNSVSSNQGYQSPWPANMYNQNMNTNAMPQMQQYNKQQQVPYPQTASDSTLGYNQGYNNLNLNPASYGTGQQMYQQTAYKNNENNAQEGYQQNAYRNNANNAQGGYQQNAYRNNANSPQEGYHQNIFRNNENNPQESYQQTAYGNNENNANFNNYLPSGSSSSSTSFSESSSPSNQEYHASVATNSYMKQNEKYDQSPSQTSYTSESNIALPGMYTNSGSSVSHSNSAYGTNYNNMQNYAQQATDQMSSTGSQLSSASQINTQSQFSDPNQLSNPNQFNNFNNLNNQNQANNPAYVNQQQPVQPTSNTNNDYSNQMSASYANYVNSGTSTAFSPPSTSSSSYSSSQSVSNDFSPPADKNYFLPSKPNNPLALIKNQTTAQSSRNTNNPNPSKSKPTFSTSYSYSYTEKHSKPEKAYSNNPKSPDFSQPENENTPKNSQTTPVQYSPQIQTPDIQSSKSKIDEMERHIHSSASSIINVYTNSPESMGGKGGQTFSFMDPTAMGSSQSATFFQPQDEDGNPKMQYSTEDLKVSSGSSYTQDPAEPLQTSLDAYVPMQPIYQPTASDQNTVYKEAMSEIDEYKEAISLNSDSGPSKKS